MNARQYRYMDRYVRRLADKMGLRDWEIIVEREKPPGEDWLASCSPVVGRRLAFIAFNDEFGDYQPAMQRQSVIHELLHCVHAQEIEQVRIHLAHAMGKQAHKTFVPLYLQAHEFAVDTLAEALSPLFPLPELP